MPDILRMPGVKPACEINLWPRGESISLPLDNTLLTEPEDEYHAKAGVYLSSHLLALFRWNPALYDLAARGLFKRPDSPAFALGRAVHVLILEGEEAYHSRYVSDSPVNPITGKPYGNDTKKYAAWVKDVYANSKEPISGSDEVIAFQLARSVTSHTEAVRLLRDAPYRERVARTTFCGIACQARMDAYGEEVGITDYKTCDKLEKLVYQARSFGYIEQLAFYRAVLREVDIPCNQVHIIATEKQFPQRTGVWKIPGSDLDVAEESSQQYIKELIACKKAGIWPTRYEEVRVLSI